MSPRDRNPKVITYSDDANNDGIPDNQMPNVVITNQNLRKRLGTILSIISLLAALAMLFFLFFPELSPGNLDDRIIAFVNAAILLVSGTYGIVVTRPNIPTINK